MTRVPARRLDWQDQFSALASHLQGLGGVVHVHAGPTSPISAFARVVRYKLETAEHPFKWWTVQINPSNASTHYVPDIVSQIQKNLKLGLGQLKSSQQPVTINVGTDNESGGDMVVSNVDIDVTYDAYGRSIQESERIDRLCAAVKEVLKTRRVALIFVDTHRADANNLADLGHKLWDGALGELTSSGLLVIDIFDPLIMATKTYSWPPEPDLIIQLPDRYDEGSRREALNDLAAIALEEGWFSTREEAQAFAIGILITSTDIRDVYTRLALAGAGLGVERDVRG